MKLLLVEDEEKLCTVLKAGLKKHGYLVDYVLDGKEGLHRLLSYPEDYDLVVLDVMLPSLSGLEVCRQLREDGIQIPIIMLTALDTKGSKVTGLDAGADDYVVKPFDFDELVARIRTLLRRPVYLMPDILRLGDLTVDLTNRTVQRGRKDITLTAKEFLLLQYFLRNRGRVLRREQILAHVWEGEADVYSNAVDVHVKNLRKKIEKERSEFIETIPNEGYRFKA